MKRVKIFVLRTGIRGASVCGVGEYGLRRILSLSKEDFRRLMEHMATREPSVDKIWIPLPKWQVDILIEEDLIDKRWASEHFYWSDTIYPQLHRT